MSKTDYERTEQVSRHMDRADVTLGMLETLRFLELFEEDLLVPMSEAFDRLWPDFHGMYADGNEAHWEQSARRARQVLEGAGMLGEEPK